MYICVTHVDSQTGIPGHKESMRNGPSFPNVKGLNVEWWDQSCWPLTHPDQYPRFYGTCDDDADTTIAGVIFVFQDNETQTAKEQYDAAHNEELKARLPSVVTARQFRLALLEMNLLDTVLNYMETLPEPTKTKVKIEWEYAVEVYKNAPAIQQLYKDLGITEEQLDEIFVKASEMGSVNPLEPQPEE